MYAVLFLCVLIFVCSKHTKKKPDTQDAAPNDTLNSPLPPNILLLIIRIPYPNKKKPRGRGNSILVGTIVKANIGEVEEEVREGCPIRTRKELTGVVQGI